MAFLGGQFKSATHGQFKSAQGGQFDRLLHIIRPSMKPVAVNASMLTRNFLFSVSSLSISSGLFFRYSKNA